MQNIDPYSYQCGVIECFNEMVRSGVKALVGIGINVLHNQGLLSCPFYFTPPLPI